MTGNPYIVSVRTPDILDKLEKHPIWQQRADFKQQALEGRLVGTGRRLRHQGLRLGRRLLARSGRDRSRGADRDPLRSRRDGQRHRHGARQPGRRTILARSPTRSRSPASTATTRSASSPRAIPIRWIRRPRTSPRRIRAGCPRSARRPAHRSAPMSARIRRPRRRRPHLPLRPVAGGTGASGALQRPIRAPGYGTNARWQDGQLVLDDLAPLPLPKLAATAHARGFVTGAIAHSFSRWAWSRARFPLFGEQVPRRRSMRWRSAAARGRFERIDRVSVKFPPTDNNRIGTAYTSMCGTLVRVEIERATGALAHRQGLQRVRMRPARSCLKWCSASRQWRLRHGCGLRAAGNPAAVRRRPRQRAMESRPVFDRARLRPATARSRNRDAAAVDAGRSRPRAWPRSS